MTAQLAISVMPKVPLRTDNPMQETRGSVHMIRRAQKHQNDCFWCNAPAQTKIHGLLSSCTENPQKLRATGGLVANGHEASKSKRIVHRTDLPSLHSFPPCISTPRVLCFPYPSLLPRFALPHTLPASLHSYHPPAYQRPHQHTSTHTNTPTSTHPNTQTSTSGSSGSRLHIQALPQKMQ